MCSAGFCSSSSTQRNRMKYYAIRNGALVCIQAADAVLASAIGDTVVRARNASEAREELSSMPITINYSCPFCRYSDIVKKMPRESIVITCRGCGGSSPPFSRDTPRGWSKKERNSVRGKARRKQNNGPRVINTGNDRGYDMRAVVAGLGAAAPVVDNNIRANGDYVFNPDAMKWVVP